ncbi:uncharacterized protein PGTG_22160 [Puccinia graminis f. sp. tritici CRL 75-36-700-3]|uniref:Uncharacterized protein n=1 Tax=Puccinia graminis f. sp. tritici (strain CRL 75-36-700-3 / race SCCL) TaxID=418459 RepID=H6QTR8_PUCGT|nr:uncharacterized protein PGTG_22160 [Puccinia graminis f. sp. tritici CRL 75-36-700-3]EHS64283.1 hypothetical protein PGTG_22160 [Puccinia graminis f. sp. tritici CRL 75-36-700-3]
MALPLRFIPQTILPYKPKCLTSYYKQLMSNSDQSKVSPAKTYSEAVSASEGTRSEPSKTTKTVKTVVKKVKKQPKSPEEVPSEWDESNLSSKSETRKTAATVVKKPVKSASRPKTLTSDGPIAPPATPADRLESTEKTQATSLPAKKKLTVPAKSNDPLPITDPFKSNEKPSKLIDKDSISHLSFKKLDREPLAKTVNNAAETSTDQAPRKSEVSVRVDTVSEAAKTLLQGPTTFNQPVERTTQKVLDNYFVPQGRTVRSVSSRSSDHPCGSTTSDSVLPSEGSDLDIITGATAQLWSKPKTLPAPLGDDILLKYRPAYHPLLQAVKLNQEYFRRAERTKDEDLKVVALRLASELQTDLLRSIGQEEFLNIFNWNLKLEFDEYLNTQKGRNFLKERGAEVTPTPSPEVQMQPQETGMPQAHPPGQQTEHQPQSQMYYHPNGYYYPYPPMNPNPQAQYWPQQSYNQEYSTFQQGYYPPQQMVNNLVPQAEQSAPPQPTRKRESDQAPKNNRNRPRNRKAKGPSWVPPPNSNRAPPDSNSVSARERRRRAHQLSIHQEMIRLSRTTQAQYQALESMRNQNAGGGSRHQPREDAQTPRN